MGGGNSTLLTLCCCFLLLLLLLLSSSDPASGKLSCHEEERSSLLVFKNSFFNESHCLYDDGSYPLKMMTWKDVEGESGDCCDWAGVICNDDDGHVVGLDLSTSCLVGRIDSTASIFDLVHLQELNLAFNSFGGSLIPTGLGSLTSLMRLNLSFSGIDGEVLPVITKLRNLSSLFLSGNWGMNVSSLEELLQSLNKLEELDLTRVTVSDGKVPTSLGNMTSLRSIVLCGCGLSGEFPDSVFELPSLEFLDVSRNHGLTGQLTGFLRGSPIKSLKLSETNFTGKVPVWLGNLSSLAEIDISFCGFWGEIPSSIGDLTKLEHMGIAFNNFHGQIPPSFANLTNLTGLDLSSNRLNSEIPWSLGNLVSLVDLDVSANELGGKIPSSLGNLTQLERLHLHSNQLLGEIPSSLMQLPELFQLGLSDNMLTGNIPPEIGNLTGLVFLGMSFNRFHGLLPDSIFQLQYLNVLNLRSNHLTGVSHLDKNISGQTTWYLDLSFNNIQGTLPIPPKSIELYFISNNRLSGEIPRSICDQENIRALDLSDNHFEGVLPLCFSNFSSSLDALSLSGNNFSGSIPMFYHEQCSLTVMDLSSNSFEGPLPRSITNCQMLGYVNFGKNKIRDTFPFWLGMLPWLKVLMLHSNSFHGVMTTAPGNGSWFPSLKVITLSGNNLEGRIPADYFARWRAMKYFIPGEETYPGSHLHVITMTIINKGKEREFGKTLGSFRLLDLSSNSFSGAIPESIGDDLQKLHTLNLSNNDFRGPIPLSFKNIKNLEVLDLSSNRISGSIPGVLTHITSLNHFNVSYNDLSGSIPTWNQFGTFENTSYIGNLGLCGSPLTRKCGNQPSPEGNEEEKSREPYEMVWITAMVGLAGGLVVGCALEQAFGADIQYWLAWKWRKYRRSGPPTSHKIQMKL